VNTGFFLHVDHIHIVHIQRDKTISLSSQTQNLQSIHSCLLSQNQIRFNPFSKSNKLQTIFTEV